MGSIYLLIDVLIAIGLLSLSVVSLIKGGYKSSVNRLFAGFSVFIALWILSNNISNNIHYPSQVALFADYVLFGVSFGAALLLLQFIVKLSDSARLLLMVDRFIKYLWALCLFFASPLLVAGVVIQGDVYAVQFGPLIWLYVPSLIYVIGLIAYGLIHGLRYAKGTRRRQILSISRGLIISMPLVVMFSFVIPLVTGIFSVTEFGITPTIILVISLYYSVVRYKLFDIRLAAVRAVTYILSLATLTVVYYAAAFVASLLFFDGDFKSSIGVNPINVILALLLAFIFQPAKRFFDKITNRFFYKDNYNSDDFFGRLNSTLSVTTNLRNLLEKSAIEIGKTLKSEQAFFFIDTSDGHYVSSGTSRHRQLPKEDAAMLRLAYNKNNDMIIASLLKTSDPIHRLMISHRIELALPLFQANKFIGHLCLGEHLMSGYTSRDMRVLNTISDELSIAIQNALAVQEIRELNFSLQQRIENATKELRASNATLRHLDKAKDEFVSMASHQLRTPLTSIKGYISMMIEGDAGEINDMQKHFLEEAFMSSERMVHLINDFLNVSRIQTGKFIIDKHPIDLSKVVKQEIDSLRDIANTRNLKFVYNQPQNFPLLEIDESKIRQVIMNFADNALYYSRPDTKINVGLAIDGDYVVFTCRDTGIGVPVEEQDSLFTKFYRASNARKQRPDGTGVGLYLAKKIIDAHDGKTVFESVEGKGSTFGFKLPINN